MPNDGVQPGAVAGEHRTQLCPCTRGQFAGRSGQPRHHRGLKYLNPALDHHTNSAFLLTVPTYVPTGFSENSKKSTICVEGKGQEGGPVGWGQPPCTAPGLRGHPQPHAASPHIHTQHPELPGKQQTTVQGATARAASGGSGTPRPTPGQVQRGPALTPHTRTPALSKPPPALGHAMDVNRGHGDMRRHAGPWHTPALWTSFTRVLWVTRPPRR